MHKDQIAPRLTWVPEIMVPAQWWGGCGGGLLPSQRLLVALLEDTRRSLRYPPESHRYQEALYWVHAESVDPPCFSFPVVCQALGFAPGWLRRRMIASAHTIRVVPHNMGRASAWQMTGPRKYKRRVAG